MTPFVRFIFLILIGGAALNLAIVMVSNAHTHQRQVEDLADERKQFADLIAIVNNHWRWGEMAVEWQRIDANENVLETSLLVRQFMPVDSGQPIPLPLHRIIIPGDRVCIDGLKLDFDQYFTEDYKELRNSTLFYFGRIYADKAAEKDRFSFLIPYGVPQATQVRYSGKNPQPTYFESKLWATIWDVIQSPSPAKRGLTATWLDPLCQKVKGGAMYKITVGLEGIKIEEDDTGLNRTLRNDMLREGEMLDSQSGEQ
jgi:hypothetical protein